MNDNELRIWRNLWAWTTAVLAAALALFGAALLTGTLDYNPDTGPGMGILGLLTLVSACSWAHFHDQVGRGQQ